MISIEFANAPINADRIRQQDLDLEGHKLIKLGLAVMVLDDSDRMYTLVHEARDKEFPQGALGPSMETFRYVKTRGLNDTETPLEAWQRSLHEEINLTDDEIRDAELYFSADSVLVSNRWILGESDGVVEYAAAVSMMVRTYNPQALLQSGRTEEVLSTSFLSLENIRRSNNNRPGFLGWANEMYEMVEVSGQKRDPVIQIEPLILPATSDYGPDVRFDG